MSACKQVQAPPVNFERVFHHHHRKDKVVVIMGATGSGKSKLAIDLARFFTPAEIVNSDKMQVYRGLDITTNKVTPEECAGVPHHLLGIADPDSDFTAADFIHHASSAVDSIVGRHCVPIIAGGSNSYIEALVGNQNAAFRSRYECCFLWVDVWLPVLHSFLWNRVDRMVENGQVEEVREMFDPLADYTRGVRRAIGVPELDEFLRREIREGQGQGQGSNYHNINTKEKEKLQKIHRLHGLWKRNTHRLDATEAFVRSGEEAEEAWENHVVKKSRRIVSKFLYDQNHVPAAATRFDCVFVFDGNANELTTP
ncbi:adenylate isopentenyltransferase 5, chloroplastic-like [Senna tora]|uniref:Adenylate isopentenyltransferase 5, chloroplastic-like n=1 Tax=Senna tora TaxID=362788 RepID=A0A834T239_9FABA|nr:adenylate isopentenyltransferase 5, chloroplastic-like [Senna tora]